MQTENRGDLQMQQNLTKEQELIRSQLTVRAIVWHVRNLAEEDIAELEVQMRLFDVRPVRVRTTGSCWEAYEEILQELERTGIFEWEAVLITDDDRMAEYVFKERRVLDAKKGMAVVFFEEDGGRTCSAADMAVLGFEETGVQFFDRICKRKNRLPWNILYTERTCVREITMTDLDELFELYQGEGITDYTESLYDRAREEEYTRNYIDYMYYYYGYGMWIVRDRENGALIGRAGIGHRDVGDEVFMELGYVIAKEYQNKGYATEVCRAVIRYAGEELGVRQIHCFIHPDNRASVRLARKLGFTEMPDTDVSFGELRHFRKNNIHIL